MSVPRHPLVLVLLAISLASCSLPATSFGSYRGKALDAAEETISQSQTAILTIELAERDRAFGRTATVQLEDAERAAAEATEAFASVLPPDDRSEMLRASILPDLERASDLLARIRFALRHDDLDRSRELGSSLEEPLRRLERWVARFT